MPKTASVQKKQNFVNLGCGRTHHPDWHNFDVNPRDDNVVAWNARSGIPLASNNTVVVYHSHLLEHLEEQDGITLLEECFRILRPENGILRIVVPDLEEICRSYLEAIERADHQNEGALEDLNWMRLELVDQLTRIKSGGGMLDFLHSDPPNKLFLLKRCGKQVEEHLILPKRAKTTQSEHKPPPPHLRLKKLLLNLLDFNSWKEIIVKVILGPKEYEHLQIGRFRSDGEIHHCMYDRFSLRSLLERIGFTDIRITAANKSCIPHWQEYLLDADKNGTPHKPDSLYLEARKPQ